MAPPFLLRVDDDLEWRQRMPEDAGELFALIEANRVRLRRWLPWLDQCTGISHVADHIDSCLRLAETGSGLALCLWMDGRIVGVGGYNHIDRFNAAGHLGYWLGEAYEGRGLITRGNRALVAHGFTVLGLRRQTIAAATGNLRSRAVAERLGFTLEGVLREAETLYGRGVDHALYAQTVGDWARTGGGVAVGDGARLAVRAMGVTDVADALELWRATEGMGLTEEETEPMLAAFLSRNPGLSAVARGAGGALLGAALAGQDGRRGFLYHLAVRADARGRGLGRELAEFALAGLRAAKIEKASIFVYAHNEAGRSFWRRLGWMERADLVVMQRKP